MLSPSDTAIVFLVALLLFGPEQLPRIARQLGDAMRHMQTATHSFMTEMDRAARVSEEPKPHIQPALSGPLAAPSENVSDSTESEAVRPDGARETD